MSRYLDLFVQEAGEHLEAMGRGLVELEKSPGPEHLDAIFRHAHSLKGMAGSMGFIPITELAHRLEDLMAAARSGALELGAEHIDVALEVTDLLVGLVGTAAETGSVDTWPAGGEALFKRLEELTPEPDGESALLPAAATALPAPAPAPQAPLQAKEGGAPLLRVRATIDPESKVPGVRAFLVHKRLSEHGEVLRCAPSLEEIKAGRLLDGGVSIVLQTEAGVGTLDRVLSNIAEVEEISIELYEAEGEREPSSAPKLEPAGGRGNTIRVRTDLLDELMDSAGELLLGVHHLRSLLPDDDLEGAPGPMHDAVDRLDKVVREVNRQVVQARMTPIGVLFDRLPRTVRDVARKVGKPVELKLEGSEIELDRAILDEIDAPLTHLVRNAVDHGFEAAEQRNARGKPSTGQLVVSAQRDRDRVIISVRDDGGGIDSARIGEKAVATGKISELELDQLTEREVLMLAALPGLSTKEEVSEVSGRGVGLDVVRDTAEGLGGTMEIDSVVGEGTTFTLRLPLTVAIQRLLLVASEAQTFAVPVNKVLHVEQVEPESWSQAHGQPVVPFQDGLIHAYDLRDWLGQREPPDLPRPHVIVENEAGEPISIAVDRLKGHLEALIKPLEAPLQRVSGLSGVAFLPEGRPVFVIDLASVARTSEHWTRRGGY
ncbi:MAG: chemotaxis protein CheA [Deltaproteobacteria bacterium]|nr:chemotaxis protein CheA [Deltaproteobacteria bacterium]